MTLSTPPCDVALRVARTVDPPGIQVVGEVDLSNVDEFASALTAAVLGVRGDVHVDMGGVTFIDVGGLRVLIRAAHLLSHGNRRLFLHSLSEITHKVIRLLGWADTPGLALSLPAEQDGPRPHGVSEPSAVLRPSSSNRGASALLRDEWAAA